MKLSETQRAVLVDALNDESDITYYFESCVYPRTLRGLERVGAVVRDESGNWLVTDEARAALK